MHPSRRGRRLGGGGSGGRVYLSVQWLVVLTCLGEEDQLVGYHVGPRSQHTCRSASAPFPRGEGPRSACVGLQCGCEGMLGGGSGAGPAFGLAPFLLGGGGAAKGLLPCFLVPKGN